MVILEASGVMDALGGALSWDSILVTKSRGSPVLDTEPKREGLRPGDRGFHLTLFDRSDNPAFYCKIRPALPNARDYREVEALRKFSSDDVARGFIPHAMFAKSSRLDLQACCYLPGQTLDGMRASKSNAELVALSRQALEVVGELSRVWASGSVGGRGASIELSQEEIGSRLELQGMGLEQNDLELINATLEECAPLPFVPQHGDLWPQNVLQRPDGTLIILDLDEFGEVSTPLYDDLHMVRWLLASAEHRGGHYIDGLLRDDEIGRAARGLLADRASEHALTPAQVGACALFYLTRVTAWLFRRNVGGQFWQPYRHDLSGFLARLRDLDSIDELGRSVVAVV